MLRILFSIGAIQVFTIVIATLRGKIFAVLLGPAGFGLVATIDQLVLSASQLSNLSVPFTAMKFLSRGHSQAEESFGKYYHGFLKVMTALALVATVVTIAAVSANLDDLDPQLAKYRTPVVIALLGLPAAMLLVFFVNALAAQQKTIPSLFLNTAYGAVMMVFGGIGCLLGGVQGLYLAAVPASTLLILGTAIYIRSGLRAAPAGRPEPLWKDLASHGEIINTAAYTYLAVAAYAVFLLLARYAVITTQGEAAAGLLQAVLAVALSLGAVLTPATSFYFTPYVNRAIPIRDKIDAADRFLPRLVFLYSLGALPLLLFPELVLRLLFSIGFTAAAGLVPVFVIWQCLYQVAYVYQHLLIGIDDVKGCCIPTMIGFAVAAALSFPLTVWWGLPGVAAAFMAGVVIVGGLCILRLHATHGFAMHRSTAFLIAMAVVGLALVALIGRATPELSLVGFGARAATAAVFLAGLWFVLPKNLSSELSSGAVATVTGLVRRLSPSA